MRWEVSEEGKEKRATRRWRRIVLSEEMLRILVQMPEGVEIVGVFHSIEMSSIQLVVCGKMFTEVDEGEWIPRLDVIYSDENGRLKLEWEDRWGDRSKQDDDELYADGEDAWGGVEGAAGMGLADVGGDAVAAVGESDHGDGV